jgi:hypothetical protein
MTAKTKKIIVWVAIAIAIFIIFFLYQRNSTKQGIKIGSTGSGTGSLITPPNPSPTPSARYVGTDFSKWKAGDALVAIAPVVNIYSAPSATSGTVQGSVKQGAWIGKFIAMQGFFAKIEYITSTLGVPYTTTGYAFVAQAANTAPNITNS